MCSKEGINKVRKTTIGLSLVFIVIGFFAIGYREFVIGGFGHQNAPPYLLVGVLLLVTGATLFVISSISGEKFSKKEKMESDLR